jgi:hypothetical protein
MNTKSLLTLAAVASLLTTPLLAVEDFSDVSGIKDACVAGSLLDANRIPYTVVVFHSLTEQGAGCLYRVNGEEYLYTVKGSAKVNPAQVAKVPLEKVPRDQVMRISDGDRGLRNGCMVFATCAFNQYKSDPHILWAGLIAAQIININSYGSEANYRASVTGHAITAFENDQREIFIQENGDEPRKVDQMTELAQRGDLSWHDSGALIYCDHHIQAVTAFKDQIGRPR